MTLDGGAAVGCQLLLVFSSPPEGVSAEEYFGWYEAHLDELLEVRGFRAARRYLVTELGSRQSPAGHSHLALYEVEGGVDEILGNMAAEGLSDKASYVRRKEHAGGEPPLPAWWDKTEFVGWTCIALGPRHVRTTGAAPLDTGVGCEG
jgi:hypothetical protein